MYGKKNILVTTTSNLQNCEINRYLGLVSARVVAGTGFLSDFIASFSDTFGGRSGTYQRQLQKINEEAIEILKEDASRRGANAVIGVRIDHDEISGKTKQMFMVTVTGTAVVVNEINKGAASSLRKNSFISLDQFEIELKKNDLIKDIKSKKLNLEKADAEIWAFLTDNKVHEVANNLLDELGKLYIKYDSYQFKVHRENLMRFFGNLDTTTAKNILYSYIEKHSHIEERKDASNLCLEIMDELNLLDLDLALNLLNSDNFNIQKKGIFALNCAKEIYTKDDIEKLQSIKDTFRDSFPNLGKQLDADKWLCQCGKENKNKHIYCKRCGRNIKGFEKSEANPEKTISLINRKLEVLKKIFY